MDDYKQPLFQDRPTTHIWVKNNGSLQPHDPPNRWPIRYLTYLGQLDLEMTTW